MVIFFLSNIIFSLPALSFNGDVVKVSISAEDDFDRDYEVELSCMIDKTAEEKIIADGEEAIFSLKELNDLDSVKKDRSLTIRIDVS